MSSDSSKKDGNSPINLGLNAAINQTDVGLKQEGSAASIASDRPEILNHLTNAQSAESSGDLAKALEQYCFVLAFAGLPNPSKADSKKAVRALVKVYAFSNLEKLAVLRNVISTIAPSSSLQALIDETLDLYKLTLPQDIEESTNITVLIDQLELPAIISGWRIAWHIDTILKDTATNGTAPSISAYAAMRASLNIGEPEDRALPLDIEPTKHVESASSIVANQSRPTIDAENFVERIDLTNDINRSAGGIVATASKASSETEAEQSSVGLKENPNINEETWLELNDQQSAPQSQEGSLVAGYITAAEMYLRLNRKDLAKPFIEDGLELDADNAILLKLYRELGD